MRPVRKWPKQARVRLSRAGGAARWSARRATSRQRPLPDFLVIGAPKSGTTSLYEYLCTHPLVCRPSTKEVNFFAFHFDRGVPWYRAHFPIRHARSLVEHRLGRQTLTGEASPAYFFHPVAAERAASVLPDAKLVAILRNPVDRAISAYHWAVSNRREHRPMEEAFADAFHRLGADEPQSDHDDARGHLRRSYVRRGHYAEQLERWYRFYDPSRLLVVETTQLTRTGGGGFDRVLEFLGLPPWRPPTFVEHLAGSYPPADPALREQLARHYEPHNAALYRLLGVDWRFESTPLSGREP